jgi:RHH-type transcriptional regulator, rel operon repressor / antitoxin RelB
MTELVSLRLAPEIRKRLDDLARVTERSRASIAAEAVKQYVDLQEWQIAEIQKGIAQADRGEFIDHAKLKAKWEKRLANHLDKARKR